MKKHRPSKAAKAAAMQLIREGAESVKFHRNSGFSDTPIFVSANEQRQTQLFV